MDSVREAVSKIRAKFVREDSDCYVDRMRNVLDEYVTGIAYGIKTALGVDLEEAFEILTRYADYKVAEGLIPSLTEAFESEESAFIWFVTAENIEFSEGIIKFVMEAED